MSDPIRSSTVSFPSDSAAIENAYALALPDVASDRIAAMSDAYLALRVAGLEDRAGYDAVHDARMVVKKLRTSVEARRVELKEDALRYSRLVDDTAKRITAALRPIETHLEREESAIDEQREALRREREAAKKKRLDDRMAVVLELGLRWAPSFVDAMRDEDFDQAVAVERKRVEDERAENARLAALEAAAREKEEAEARARRDREAAEKAERERLAAIERQKAEDARREQEALERAERERQEEERRKAWVQREAELQREREIEAERRAEAERKLQELAEAERRRQAEAQAAAEAEARRQHEEAEAARAAALRPDAVKLRNIANELRILKLPPLHTDNETRVRGILNMAASAICEIAID